MSEFLTAEELRSLTGQARKLPALPPLPDRTQTCRVQVIQQRRVGGFLVGIGKLGRVETITSLRPWEDKDMHAYAQIAIDAAMQSIHAFEWCDCIYESGFSVVSLHASKEGAYRAMKAYIFQAWEDELSLLSKIRHIRGGARLLSTQAWRIKTYEVTK